MQGEVKESDVRAMRSMPNVKEASPNEFCHTIGRSMIERGRSSAVASVNIGVCTNKEYASRCLMLVRC